MTSTPTESSMTPSHESLSDIIHPSPFNVLSDDSVTGTTTTMEIDTESLTEPVFPIYKRLFNPNYQEDRV